MTLFRLLLSLSLAGSTTLARANVFDTYGQGAGTLALGNATTASGQAAYAAYTNPASLTLSDRNEVASHLLMSRLNLRELPPATDSRLPPERAAEDDIQGASLGIHLALSEALHFGLAAYVPQGKVGRIRGLSPRQTTYLRYDQQQQKPIAFTSLAYKLSDNFAIGAGAYYSLRARGSLLVELGREESEGRLALEMEPVVVPYGGLLWTSGAWKVGVTYRQAQETVSEIDAGFAFSTDEATLPFAARTSLVAFFDPAQTRLGLSWETDHLRLYAGVEEAQWSRYRAPVVQLTGADVAALSGESRSAGAGLRNSQAYRLGAALPLVLGGAHAMDLRLGYEYHSSARRGDRQSSIVDPNRQSLAFGTRWALPADALGRQLALEAAYQLSYLDSFQSFTAPGTVQTARAGSLIHTLAGGLNYAL